MCICICQKVIIYFYNPHKIIQIPRRRQRKIKSIIFNVMLYIFLLNCACICIRGCLRGAHVYIHAETRGRAVIHQPLSMFLFVYGRSLASLGLTKDSSAGCLVSHGDPPVSTSQELRLYISHLAFALDSGRIELTSLCLQGKYCSN